MANDETRRSRIPDFPTMGDSQVQFLDGVDKRQQRLGELDDLEDTATTAEIIAKINAILQTHRTR